MGYYLNYQIRWFNEMKTIEKATKLITHASVKVTFEDNSWYIHNLLSKKTMKTSR